jgi:hypothetical protein
MGHGSRCGFAGQCLVAVVFGGLAAAGGMASGQSITEFPIPTPLAAPEGITAGPDGNLWFTEQAANKIGRITTSSVTDLIFKDGFQTPSGARPQAKGQGERLVPDCDADGVGDACQVVAVRIDVEPAAARRTS